MIDEAGPNTTSSRVEMEEESKCNCEHCGGEFSLNENPTIDITSATLYECPFCDRWTEAR